MPTLKPETLRKRFGDALILSAARAILGETLSRESVIDSPRAAREYIAAQLHGEEREHFIVAFLDAQHRVITSETMFSGTLSQTSVYPREVVKRALALNAGAVIFAHNHPSGLAEPSRADEYLTQTLKSALAMVDIRVLDHIVCGAGSLVSFAERGLL